MSTQPAPQQYCFFPRVSESDLAKLHAELDKLMAAAKAPNTLKAYSQGWKCFKEWCIEWQRDPLPAHPEAVREFVGWAATMRKPALALGTIELAVTAIKHFHLQANLPSPVDKRVRDAVAGFRRDVARLSDRPEDAGKKNLTTAQLRKICRSLGNSEPIEIRDRAIVLLGFASALRRSELDRLDTKQARFEGDRIRLFIPFSKTDQEGEGRVVYIDPAKNELLCPVRALRAWRECRITHCGNFRGPLFTRFGPWARNMMLDKALSGAGINRVLKGLLERIGEDASEYGAHSMRSGMVTEAMTHGANLRAIMNRTGHKRVGTVLRYAKNVPGDNPLAGVL